MCFNRTLQKITTDEERKVHKLLESPYEISFPIKPSQVKEVKSIIHKKLKNRIAPGSDLITGTVLKKLSDCAVKLITYIHGDPFLSIIPNIFQNTLSKKKLLKQRMNRTEGDILLYHQF